MADEMIRVLCTLKDCYYYSTNPNDLGHAYCSHPDKRYYMQGLKCPLYRLDVTRKMSNLQEKLEQRKKKQEG